MKKHTIKLILLVLILFTGSISCTDILDQTNPNALSTENFWQNEQQVQEALVGTYSPMSTVCTVGEGISH